AVDALEHAPFLGLGVQDDLPESDVARHAQQPRLRGGLSAQVLVAEDLELVGGEIELGGRWIGLGHGSGPLWLKCNTRAGWFPASCNTAAGPVRRPPNHIAFRRTF